MLTEPVPWCSWNEASREKQQPKRLRPPRPPTRWARRSRQGGAGRSQGKPSPQPASGTPPPLHSAHRPAARKLLVGALECSGGGVPLAGCGEGFPCERPAPPCLDRRAHLVGGLGGRKRLGCRFSRLASFQEHHGTGSVSMGERDLQPEPAGRFLRAARQLVRPIRMPQHQLGAHEELIAEPLIEGKRWEVWLAVRSYQQVAATPGLPDLQ